MGHTARTHRLERLGQPHPTDHDEDGTPEGIHTLCCVCWTAIVVRRYQGHGYNYCAWAHYNRAFAHTHDPEPAKATARATLLARAPGWGTR